MVMIQFARTGTAVIMAMAVAGFSWVVLARSELLADDPKAARPKPAASPPHAGKPGTGSLGVFLSRGGPQRTGSISSTRVLEHPAVQWSFSTKGEPGAPLLADGVIYVGDRSETFYAVNLSDGTVLWQTEGLGHVYFSPAKCGETLYVNSNKGLTALSQSDGRVRWQCKVEGDLTESSPLIVKDRIIVADTSGTMYAVDLNGKIIWEHDMLDDEQVQLKRAELEHMKRQLLRGGGQVARPTTAASDGTTIFQPIFDESRVLLAIDLEAGKRRWSFHAKGMSYGGPAVTDDRVFFGTQGANEFYCLDKRRKTVSWTFPVQSRIEAAPGYRNGSVFFGSFDGQFYRVNAETGKEIWRYQTPKFPGVNIAIYSAPVFTVDAVLFGSFDGFLYCLGIDNGELKWRFQPVKDSETWASPLVEGQRIVLAIRRNNETKRGQDAIVVIGEDEKKK